MHENGQRALARRLGRELETLRERAELRMLERPGGINLCSNDYLGLASDPRLKRAALDAMERAAAVGSTGSRLLSGNAREWEELEAEFAEFAGSEAALYFGSGYAANLGLLSSILGPGDVVFSDALNHASLIDGMRLSRATKVIYPHSDMEFLGRELRCHAGSWTKRMRRACEGHGDAAWLPSLARRGKFRRSYTRAERRWRAQVRSCAAANC
jgi:8-amino-7-oxononanoate synthase